jgi:indole-3-glycerol phosphate synthase
MSSILDRIVVSKRQEIAAAQKRVPRRLLEQLLADAPPIRNFHAALSRPDGVQIIAEIKKASPSAGVFREELDLAEIARAYARYGAAAISVLTDSPFFQGSLDNLVQVRQVATIPVLRKDFILDLYQVLEARVHGADAVLLIAEILDDAQLAELLAAIHDLGMEALVELYEPTNLSRVLASGATVIGINNRNLHSFQTSLHHTLSLAPHVPRDRCLVSESGIRDRSDVEQLQAAGVKAILVGETLMRATDLKGKLEELRGLSPSR